MFYKEVTTAMKIIDLYVGVINAMAEELDATSILGDYEPPHRIAFPEDKFPMLMINAYRQMV